MSNPVPERAITGLVPRPKPAAGALLKQNRPASTSPSPTSEPQNDASASTPAEASRPRTRSTRSAAKARTTSKKQSAGNKVQLTADVLEDVRGRARAAYRAAAYFEQVATFSQFIENAVIAEVQRIEAAYNDGKPLEPVTENLPSGRPAGA